ncbi:MAG: flavodoxin family protein [Clostridia bacterium]|nr:flavodoxin family protein [Clostridia bacterium]
MNTLVLYYSLTGRTHYEAKRKAEALSGELYEVREQRRRSLLSANIFGPGQARKRALVFVEPIAVRMEEYDRIVILCPIWGGYPAPAFNSIVAELPAGKEVEIVLTSDTGRAKALDELKTRVERMGVTVTRLEVIRTEDLKKRDRRRRKRMKQNAE